MHDQSQLPQDKPTVFILNLDEGEPFEDLFDQLYPDFADLLVSKYRVQRARKPDAAFRHLSNLETRPVAILIVDPGVVKLENVAVFNLVKQYVQGGGIAVFMACFSSFIRPDDMDKFWQEQWGLGWRFGEYHRTDVHLNRNTPSLSLAFLPALYSQKAIFLKHVAPTDSLYLPTPESRIQSAVFPPEPVNHDQTPVAFTKLDYGWLGYIGDINNEVGSQKVALEMCRFATYIAGAH